MGQGPGEAGLQPTPHSHSPECQFFVPGVFAALHPTAPRPASSKLHFILQLLCVAWVLLAPLLLPSSSHLSLTSPFLAGAPLRSGTESLWPSAGTW